MAKTTLYLIGSERYFDGLIRIFKDQLKDKTTIFVTTNKPYSHLSELFKKNGVSTSRIFFIDCISHHVGEQPSQEATNCLYMESPQSLTSISIAISETVKRLPGSKALLLDSLSTLLIYNDAETLGKFSNFVINKLRKLEVEMLIIALESDASNIVRQVESFADEVKKDK